MNKTHKKSGDDGFTSLANGKRIKKHSDSIELYGCIDELNVALGYAAESLCSREEFQELFKQVYRVRRELFELGSHFFSTGKFTINAHKIGQLETEIDAMSERLPILRSPILPSGGDCALRIHLARAICRRAERITFKLAESDGSAEIVGVYFNRLSDWLYISARTAALIANVEETLL